MSASNIWAITSYYNPLKYQRREANFQRFREALDLPLIVVELSVDGTFQVPSDERTVVIKVNSQTVLWHKETLLNRAIAQIPDDAKYVAWLDCDILFQNPGWIGEAAAALEKHPVVQLFSELYDLGPDGVLLDAGEPSGKSVVSQISQGTSLENIFRPQTGSAMRKTAYGLAWACHLSLIRKHEIYDAMIVGSGDIAFAAAAYGRFDDAVEALHLSPGHSRHFLSWAHEFYKAVKGNVGYVPGAVNHLWHGDIGNRAYKDRHKALGRHDFDPGEDLVRDSDGVWQWRRDGNDIQLLVEEYFASRREDDVEG
jgi:glycosyltransferase involved in cell wall biosynthesis